MSGKAATRTAPPTKAQQAGSGESGRGGSGPKRAKPNKPIGQLATCGGRAPTGKPLPLQPVELAADAGGVTRAKGGGRTLVANGHGHANGVANGGKHAHAGGVGAPTGGNSIAASSIAVR